jgi:hypothetical protein
MTRMNPGTLIVSALLLVGALMVLANSNITIPAGGWLIASLLGAASILVGGELLIKKFGLTDYAARATRFAFTVGAIVVAVTGISSVMTGNLGVPGMPAWIQTGVTTLGRFGVISLGVIAATMIFGIYRYTKIPGNTSAYLFMAAVGFFFFFGGIYVVSMTIAPNETTLIIESAANDARSAASDLVETDPNGVTSIRWEKFQGIDWGTVGGIAFACFLAFVFLQQYLGKNKIVVMVAAIVASLAFLLLSYHFATKWEVSNNFIQGAVELNPALGETKRVHITLADTGRNIPVFLGPHDNLVVSIPMGGYKACADASTAWKANHGSAPWFDPNAFASYSGQSVNKRLTLSDTLTDGMQQAGVSGIDLMVSAIRTNTSCPTL